jgi:hypothetical protein
MMTPSHFALQMQACQILLQTAPAGHGISDKARQAVADLLARGEPVEAAAYAVLLSMNPYQRNRLEELRK